MIEHLAIVGATGAVGQELCKLLIERSIQTKRLTLLASQRSSGKKIQVGLESYQVETLSKKSFAGVDYAIFSAGTDQSVQYAPLAVKAGAVVIDNSSAYRMADDVPLVIPEINPDDAFVHTGIIANPNCSTIIMNMAVWPLHAVNPVKRIVVSTYQAASGAGAAAMAELRSQTADILADRSAEPHVFPYPIAFNLFSHNTPIDELGSNTEERKMIDETRKVFHTPELAISATCVRVPVFRAHSEAINLTFDKPMTPDKVRNILADTPGVRVVDDRNANHFPMPIDASGQNDCLVGRIRQDTSQPDGRGIDLFVSGDQIRKGAALNAIQILELLTELELLT